MTDDVEAKTDLEVAATAQVTEVLHPLVQHKIGLMRNAALSTKDFRELANELGTLLA